LNDDHTKLIFCPKFDGGSQDGDFPPFYVSFNVHDLILHNAMLDSGASHNLMQKVIMDKLGLDIIRPYKDIFSFDLSKVKCLGSIKDLVISLSQIVAKLLVVDIVFAKIPPKISIFLSRSWPAKLEGTLQMDRPYATIPIFR